MFLVLIYENEQSKLKVEGCFRFDFQPMGGLDLFVTGRSHFLLSQRSISFNNVMITLTSSRLGARIVELASGSCLLISSLPGLALKTLSKSPDSTSILKVLHDKLNIKRHSSSILCFYPL